jgi:hypothetical protein
MARTSSSGRIEKRASREADGVVVGLHPELAELVGAGPVRIEPHGTGRRLAELGAVSSSAAAAT